jgi:cyclopropane fatty-acyl-phospholipid synthase-like methyltransferase
VIFSKETNSVMDVGGNTGKFAIQCSGYNSSVNITVVDLPGQIAVAEKNIKDRSLAGRVKFHGVNLLDKSEPLPVKVDVVWMSQFLDCFSPDEIVSLLKRAKEALNPGGRIFILETFWDNQRFKATSFCLQNISLYFTAMANGNSKMYASTHMVKLVEQAGLTVKSQNDRIGVAHTLLECIPQAQVL